MCLQAVREPKRWQLKKDGDIAMKKLLSALCITAILFSGTALFGGEYNPGKAWLEMSETGRLVWVWGFTKGQELTLEELQIKSTNNLNYLILYKDAEAISKIMSQDYNDAANTYIPWKYMTFIAKMKLEGNPVEKIGEQLELLRQYAAYEREKPKE